MKNYFKLMSLFLGMALCTTAFVACGSDDDDNTSNGGTSGGSVSNVIGTWEDSFSTYTFTDKELTITTNEQLTFNGAYKIENGQLKYTQTVEGREVVNTATIKLLYGMTVMVLKTVPDNPDDYSLSEVAQVLFKKGTTPNIPVSDIQGTWHWYMRGDTDYVRTGLTINGNKFDMIITPWGQRYTGTFTYSKGVMKLNTEHGYTSREAGTGYGSGEGSLDAKTLEGQWNTLDIEHWTIWEEMPFIADGSEAYGWVAGLPAVFVKK